MSSCRKEEIRPRAPILGGRGGGAGGRSRRELGAGSREVGSG